jgi:putative FmdB family regulatory protein
MPIFDYLCEDCGEKCEILTTVSNEQPECSACGGRNLKKMISKPSSFTGGSASGFPGPGDTACCGSNPSEAGCAGPGSCCGKTFP